jgi:hypothetical protein
MTATLDRPTSTLPGTIHVEVTAEDIANGVRANSHQCPIALAVRRAVPYALIVSVDDEVVITLSRDGFNPSFHYQLTDEAEHFIWYYDGEEVEVKPFDTYLTYIDTDDE